MTDLRDPIAKLGRADHHLNALQGCIERFKDSKPYAFQLDAHPKPPEYVIRAHINQSPPNDFGLIIGDFAHNARSALDVLIFQLSMLSDTDRGRDKLGFPIVVSKNNYASEEGKSLNGVRPSHRAIIEGLQPYNGLGANDPLELLRNINNSDKHKVINAVGAIGRDATITVQRPAPNVGRMTISGGTAMFPNFTWRAVSGGVISEDGAIVARLTMKAEAQMDMKPDLQIEVQFGEGPAGVQERPVVDTLTFIRDRVKEVLGQNW